MANHYEIEFEGRIIVYQRHVNVSAPRGFVRRKELRLTQSSFMFRVTRKNVTYVLCGYRKISCNCIQALLNTVVIRHFSKRRTVS